MILTPLTKFPFTKRYNKNPKNMYRLIKPNNTLNVEDWTARPFTLELKSVASQNNRAIAEFIFFRTIPSIPRLRTKCEFEAHPD